MALHEDEVRADLRRWYSVSLEDVGGSVSWRDAAAMVAHLPSDSALMRSVGDGWSEAEHLLASIEYSLRVLRWQRTKDAVKRRNAPEPLPSPSERRRSVEPADRAEMKRVADALGIPKDRRI